MPSPQDPFYIVKEEIQDSIIKLQSSFQQWEGTGERFRDQAPFTEELLSDCESIEWQVDELDKTIAVASKNPAYYGIDRVELDERKRWTISARAKVGTMKKALALEKPPSDAGANNMNGIRQELMRLADSHHPEESNPYISANHDDFISSESERQLLLIRQQDEELDELSASVERIGEVGLTIHDELTSQDKILDGLGLEMDNTASHLDFLQKKVAMVMKKAGAKGQIMLIVFLLLLFVVLFVLVFFT